MCIFVIILYVHTVYSARKSIIAITQTLHQCWQFPNPEYYQFIDRLADEITQLAAHLDAGTYRLLKLIGKFDENKGWNGEGILSCVRIN